MPDIIFRRADEDDLPQIVAMLADDPLGAAREDASLPLQASYVAAFMIIDNNPAQLLAVAEVEGRVVGTLQLNFVVGIARQGLRRGLIESVRVAEEWRGRGLGGRMVRWAIEECKRRGCGLVQLVSDRSREDAQRFYERLGFKRAQVGMKLEI